MNLDLKNLVHFVGISIRKNSSKWNDWTIFLLNMEPRLKIGVLWQFERKYVFKNSCDGYSSFNWKKNLLMQVSVLLIFCICLNKKCTNYNYTIEIQGFGNKKNLYKSIPHRRIVMSRFCDLSCRLNKQQIVKSWKY